MTQTKRRDSNFELLRIVAMVLVMLVHVNYAALGGVTHEELLATPWTGFVRILCEQLCIICVNLFILLSGWFGIRPTLGKLASLLFQVLFVGIVVAQACRLCGFEVESQAFLNLLHFGSSYWFVPSYIILFCIAPVLNSFCEHASKRDYLWVLVAFFVAQTIFGWVSGDSGNFHSGYSAMSFVGLYLLARYVRLHGEKLRNLAWWKYLAGYMLFTAIPVATSFVGHLYLKRELGAISYASPFVIAASLSFFLMFYKFHFESKIVNWLSVSAFAIYLVHQAPGGRELYYGFFDERYHTMSGWLFIPFAIGVALAVGLASILLDKVRIALWNTILKAKSQLIK